MSSLRRRRSVAFPALPGAPAAEHRWLAWHPHRRLLAVASTSTVAFYDAQHQTWLPLRLSNDLMQGITGVSWNPYAEMVAVACSRGVCLWRLMGGLEVPGENGVLDSRYGAPSAWMSFLQQPARAPTVGLAWSRHGRLLATAAEGDPRVLVWDVALRTFTPLHTGPLGAPLALAWSPDGRFLWASFADGGFGIWEAQRWTFVSWEFPGQCRVVSWSPDSQRIALVMNNVGTEDLVWFRPDGGAQSRWVRGRIVELQATGRCVVELDEPGEARNGQVGDAGDVGQHLCQLEDLIVDKPVFVGSVQDRDDALGDFNVEFDCAYLPPPVLDGTAAPPLCGGLARGLEWAPDGGSVVVTFEHVELGAARLDHEASCGTVAAVCTYSVTGRRDTLNFALTQVLDLRRVAGTAPSPEVKCWPRLQKKEVLAAAVWNKCEDIAAGDREEAPHLALYCLPACSTSNTGLGGDLD
uniref:Anaphase-promoting complex subunit 4 WD40 domain-containing protein n=1 Tax=Rhizochromulina marina TaxID=1034831 RepID=A0A7S2R6E4_9STRA